MSYEEFKREYYDLLRQLFKYTPDQAGHNIYCSKLADLVELYPEYEEKVDNEELNNWK